MRHTQNQDRLDVIIKMTHYAIIPDSISPQTRFIARQDSPVLAGISLS